MCGSCECLYLIDILYGSVGGYQVVARVSLCGCMWLPGCLYLIVGGCQEVAMQLPRFLFVVAMGLCVQCVVCGSCECFYLIYILHLHLCI